MNKAPEFAAYPQHQAPVFSRWWVIGVALLALLIGGVMRLIKSGSEDEFTRGLMPTVGVAGVLLLWLFALLLRVLFYHFNRHSAQCYAETAQQIQHNWWVRHRQHAAFVEVVLVGAICTSLERRQVLFCPDRTPPAPLACAEGQTLRMSQVSGSDIADRERQLAILLVLQWCEQRADPAALQPLYCYWQGSLTAWDAFVGQMATSCPQVQLPERPELWEGLHSLNVIIDQLQGSPSDARILCAGCQSSTPQNESRLPAGEAALLWLIGPNGGVRFSRGEWFATDAESLASVAKRAVQQRKPEAPAPACVAFSQPHVPDLSSTGWNTKQHAQDANFGALGDLEAMTALTLAACYAVQHDAPCAWLASDPHHTLVLGVIEPDDSVN